MPSTDLRRPCSPSASLRPPLLAHASTDALAPVLGRASHLSRLVTESLAEGSVRVSRNPARRAERALRLCGAPAPRRQAVLGLGGRLALLQPGQRAFDRLPCVGARLAGSGERLVRPAPRPALPADRRAPVGLPLARVHGGGLRH